jgi:hypothetical protein
MTTMKQGVLHTMALPYIWFYMQEEKSIIDMIDVFSWLHFLLIYKKKQSYGSLTFYVSFVKEAKARYMVW